MVRLSITLEAVPGLSGARATSKRLLFCILEKFVCVEFYHPAQQQSFEGDVRVRTKSRLPKDNRRNITGQESAKESASV